MTAALRAYEEGAYEEGAYDDRAYKNGAYVDGAFEQDDLDTLTAREVCASLLDRLVRNRRREWASISVAADSGTRVRARYADSALHDLTVQAVRGYAVRSGTAGGLLFAAGVDPRLELVDELGHPGAAVPGTPLSTVDSLRHRPDIARLRGWLAAADEAARSAHPAIRQLVIDVDVVQRTTWLGLPGAAPLADDRGLAYFVLRAVAADGAQLATASYEVGGAFPALDATRAGGLVAGRAVRALSGRPVPAGQLPVVIAGGLLLPPARTAGPLVSIVDDPGVAGAAGSYRVDDEGVAAQRTVLVSAGTPAGVLTDRDSAHRLGVPLSGNGRCESALHPPLPRPANRCLEPGNLSAAQLLADTRTGIYVEAARPIGQAGYRVTSGYLIENGVLGEPIAATTVRGGLLAGVDAVADDPTVGATREYSGGQWVPVGVVTPTYRGTGSVR